MSSFDPKMYGQIGASFADWRKMAGFAKDSPFPDEPQTGVAPPTFEQELERVKATMGAIPGAFNQAMSGDFSGAAKSLQPVAPRPVAAAPAVMSPTPATAAVLPAQYDYSNIDD